MHISLTQYTPWTGRTAGHRVGKIGHAQIDDGIELIVTQR